MANKYGLVLGLNYKGTEMELNGCLNDADYWYSVLEKLDYTEILLNKESECKKSRIVDQIVYLLNKAKTGDLVAITYSGHGTIIPPGTQSWVPFDFDWGVSDTWLTYDQLDQLFLEHEARGVTVAVLSDSCHSQADPRKHFRSLNDKKDIKNRFLPPPDYIERRIIASPFERNILTSDQDDILLSGCQKSQTSADADFDNKYNGAFTYAMGTVLKPFMDGTVKNPPSYAESTAKARVWLAANDFDQIPSADGDPDLLAQPLFQVVTKKSRGRVSKTK
jgi:hypothetical protein